MPSRRAVQHYRNPIEFPVVERVFPDHFTSYTRGSYLSADAAQRAARKQAKLGGQPIIVHQPASSMYSEYWVVGYVESAKENPQSNAAIVIGLSLLGIGIATTAANFSASGDSAVAVLAGDMTACAGAGVLLASNPITGGVIGALCGFPLTMIMASVVGRAEYNAAAPTPTPTAQ